MKTKRDMWNDKGIWLRGNTHAHTTNSDGTCSAEAIGLEYGRHGYDFVFLTDHDHRTVPSKKIKKPLLIPAEEVHFTYKGYCYHFVCLGLKKAWPCHSFHSPMQLLARARRENVFIVQAHPYWCGYPSRECIFPGKLTCPALEVYNNVCDILNDKGYANVHWDDVLDAGHRILGLAVDDTHNAGHVAGGWIMVKAASRSPEAILSAIRKGNFYSSQGPEIKSIVVSGREVRINCSPVGRVNFISNRSDGCTISAAIDSLTSAVWTAPRGKRYVRIEIVSTTGKTAWSNPVYFPG